MKELELKKVKDINFSKILSSRMHVHVLFLDKYGELMPDFFLYEQYSKGSSIFLRNEACLSPQRLK